MANLTSESDRHRWVKKELDFILKNNLDGINIDIEAPIAKRDQGERDGLSLIVWEMYTRFEKFKSTLSGEIFHYSNYALRIKSFKYRLTSKIM